MTVVELHRRDFIINDAQRQAFSQPHSQGLLCFQDADWAWRRPWDTLAKYYSPTQTFFGLVTHSSVASPKKVCIRRLAKYSMNRFLYT